MPKDCDLPSTRTYAVSFTSLVSSKGRLEYSTETKLRRALKLDSDAELLAITAGSDRRLENFWRRSEELGSWKQLQELGFAALTSATFSVWDCQPRFDQIYNQDRNLTTSDLVNAIGSPAIPFIFCAAPEDYSHAAKWLERRPQIGTVAHSAQHFEHPRLFELFLDHLRRFLDCGTRPFHHLVLGCATEDKVRQVFQVLRSATIVTGQPVHKGLSGWRCSDGLTFEEAPKKVPKEALIAQNIESFELFCNAEAAGTRSECKVV